MIDGLGVLLVPYNAKSVGYGSSASDGNVALISFANDTLSPLGRVASVEPIRRAVPLPPVHVGGRDRERGGRHPSLSRFGGHGHRGFERAASRRGGRLSVTSRRLAVVSRLLALLGTSYFLDRDQCSGRELPAVHLHLHFHLHLAPVLLALRRKRELSRHRCLRTGRGDRRIVAGQRVRHHGPRVRPRWACRPPDASIPRPEA